VSRERRVNFTDRRARIADCRTTCKSAVLLLWFTPMRIDIRLATAIDLETVASLHSESWRHAYRGLIADQLLDQDLLGNRRALWRVRLAGTEAAPRHTWLILGDDQALGFASLVLDADPQFGTLLDALHIRADFKGRGLGRALLQRAAHTAQSHRGSAPIHLWVLDGNWRASRFYEALGARHAGMRFDDHLPHAPSYDHRYRWPGPEALLQALSAVQSGGENSCQLDRSMGSPGGAD
jgi:GNAT superfamily N-acetyltransferase